ncbi:COX15/CtaA family protein [Caldalkalibacillus mannanilyticus]|uniref:COX15/CtaA family protein n=1 Tax=Caldalkalibacillus mannanilyticus TaxID=1418 RepID=UPI001F330417|nr:COX15/CtaA family protein [Caldalkalibacillus mannanilyticus]
MCHGHLIPPEPTLETVIEYSHRLVTGVVGLMILILCIWVAVKYKRYKEIRYINYSAIFFLLLQSALGAMAVVFGQSNVVKASHFGFSLLAFASILLLCVYIFQLDKRSDLPVSLADQQVKKFTGFLFIYTYIVVYLGAYVRHTGSGMGCEGWPLCNGQIIPELSGQTGVQFGHRVAALFLLFGFIALFLYVRKKLAADRILYWSSFSLAVLCFLQVISGGVMIHYDLHLYASLIHALIISILFGILCYLILYVFRKK